jgi:hypothetical protein
VKGIINVCPEIPKDRKRGIIGQSVFLIAGMDFSAARVSFTGPLKKGGFLQGPGREEDEA